MKNPTPTSTPSCHRSMHFFQEHVAADCGVWALHEARLSGVLLETESLRQRGGTFGIVGATVARKGDDPTRWS